MSRKATATREALVSGKKLHRETLVVRPGRYIVGRALGLGKLNLNPFRTTPAFLGIHLSQLVWAF